MAAGTSPVYVNETQVVSTTSDHLWEVQAISISNTSTAAINGTFQLMWNSPYATRSLRSFEFDEYVEVCLRWHRSRDAQSGVCQLRCILWLL